MSCPFFCDWDFILKPANKVVLKVHVILPENTPQLKTHKELLTSVSFLVEENEMAKITNNLKEKKLIVLFGHESIVDHPHEEEEEEVRVKFWMLRNLKKVRSQSK